MASQGAGPYGLGQVRADEVLEGMAEGLFVVDADCRITYWNRAMADLTGWRADEVRGKPCSHLICVSRSLAAPTCPPGRDSCALLAGAAPGAAPAADVVRRECTLRTRSGHAIPVLKSARVVLDAAGQPAGVVGTLTDLRPLRPEPGQTAAPPETLSIRGAGRLVGSSRPMQQLYEQIGLAAETDTTVLIEGETGTGKELVAEAIHDTGPRRQGPLVKVNCAALPETLLESELFGHVRGAFTGAARDKKGRVEIADGGTLMLDEIGDVSPLIQLKLLRLLQEHEYERVGEARPRAANVRFIVATHRDLRQLVAGGTFRADFFYRIHVFTLRVPPLRERKQDLPALCEAFIDKLNRSTGRRVRGLSSEAMHNLMDYCWPGNVRELENAIEHAFVTCAGDTIGLVDLPPELRTSERRAQECSGTEPHPRLLASPRRPLTRDELELVLREAGWNRSEAARRLQVDRTTIWRHMRRWALQPPV